MKKFAGSQSLDGVYTLLEERSLSDLAPHDQDICQVHTGEQEIQSKVSFFHQILRMAACMHGQARLARRNTVLQVSFVLISFEQHPYQLKVNFAESSIVAASCRYSLLGSCPLSPFPFFKKNLSF